MRNYLSSNEDLENRREKRIEVFKECGAPACGEQLGVVKEKAMGLYLLLHGPADIGWDSLEDLLPKVEVLMLFPAPHADAAAERVRKRYPRIQMFPVWLDADRHERFELLQCRAMRWMQDRSRERVVFTTHAGNGPQNPGGIRELLAALTVRDDIKDAE